MNSSEPERHVAVLRTRVRPCKITKIIEVREGETNIYQTHLLEGFKDGMSL